MNIRTVSLLFLAVLSGGSCLVQADDAKPENPAAVAKALRGKVSGFGIYQTEQGGTAAAPGTQLGTIDEGKAVPFKLIEQTRTIPGKIGTSFGFEWTIPDPALTKAVTFTNKTIHPPSTNPKTGESVTVEQFDSQQTPNLRQFRYFKFDYDWEIVAGEWIFQVFLGTELVAEQRFTVVRE